MNSLTILFDPGCGLCRRATAWLAEQPSHVQLVFVAAGSDEAVRRYPALDPNDTLTQVTAVADDGRVWRGDAAWITCLWALRDYRAWSRRFTSPLLRPMAKAFFDQVSKHRLEISRFLAAQSATPPRTGADVDQPHEEPP